MPAGTAARQLNEQDIIDAALRLVRRTGADKLSMRKLAAELGVTPMAIYYHVPNKDALLDRLIDAVLANVPMPTPSPDRWQAQMKAYAVTSRQLFSAYPDLSRIMLSRGKNKSALALARYGISILLAAGFDAREAALAISAYHTYLYGAYVAMHAPRPPAPRSKPVDARKRGAAGPADVSAVTRELREMRMHDAIDYGIDAVLNGIGQARTKRRVRASD